MQDSKAVSNRAKEKMIAAERLQRRLYTTRSEYNGIANRVSALYFCVSAMVHVDSMYQFSLDWFVRLFQQSLAVVTTPKRTPARIKDIINTFTYMLYTQVTRALFSKVRVG
jgi:dynein heavy chain